MECSMPVTNTDAPQRHGSASTRHHDPDVSPCAIKSMPCQVSSHAWSARSSDGRLRGRRQVETEECKRDVEQAPHVARYPYASGQLFAVRASEIRRSTP